MQREVNPWYACGLLALSCLPVLALASTLVPAVPPPEWVDYITATRKADRIVDLEQRCLAYPDLPGNEWPAGAAIARCVLMRRPMLTLDEIEKMLSQPGGAAELDKRYASLLQAHYDDPLQKEQIFVSYEIFDKSEHSQRVAEQWLGESPKSTYAKLALGVVHAEQGWHARGDKFAKETPRASLEAMQKQFLVAVPLLLEALKQEPRLSPACNELAAIGRMSSDRLQQGAMAACLSNDPASYHVLREWLMEAQPKWGGSADAMRSVVAYTAARVDKYPILGSLLAAAAGYDASNEHDLERSLPGLVSAVKIAPNAFFMSLAAGLYESTGHYWEGLAYSSQALRFHPKDANSHHLRAKNLNGLGDPNRALAEAHAAVDLEPDSGFYLFELGRTEQLLHGGKAGRSYFRRAIDDTLTRQTAYAVWCGSFDPETESSDAVSCSATMTQDYSGDPEAWRLRAMALGAAGDPSVYGAIEHFLATMHGDIPYQESWADYFRTFVDQMPREKFVSSEVRQFYSTQTP